MRGFLCLGKDRISVYPELSVLTYITYLLPDKKEFKICAINMLLNENIAVLLQDL